MRGNDAFIEFVKREFGCDSMYSYVIKVFDDLNAGIIDNLNSVVIFIDDNFDNEVYEHFLICCEDVLSGNARVTRIYNEVMFDVDDVKTHCRKL